jgi:hypothetical protein
MTGGALAVGGGWNVAQSSAISYGLTMAVIVGVGIGIQRLTATS